MRCTLSRPGLFAALALCLLTATACGGGGGGSGPAPEVLLTQLDRSLSGGTSVITNYLDFRLSGGPNGTDHTTPIASFLGVSASGHVFTADPTHPAHADLVAALTNGVDEEVNFRTLPGGSGGSGWSASEDFFFGMGNVGGLTPDASGYVITRIELEVHSIGLTSPGADPNNNGVWTDYSFNVSLRVFGRAAP